MDEGKKKQVMIGVVVLCLVLAAVITIATNTDSSGPKSPVNLRCANQKCNYIYELSQKEYKNQIEELGPKSPNWKPRLACPECSKNSAFVARKCQKCDEIFLPNPRQKYPDKCTKCGYSPREERRKR